MHKVILADDHELIRDSLRNRLEAAGDVRVVAQAGDGVELINLLAEMECDLVVLDLAMPGKNGLEVLADARLRYPTVLWVVLSGFSDYEREARRLGASGYLLKSEPGERVADAVRSILKKGGMFFSPGLVSGTSPEGELVAAATPDTAPGILSKRELQILRLISRGLKHAEIAAELGVVERTVEFHKSNIKTKLKLSTTAHLIQYAVRHGLA